MALVRRTPAAVAILERNDTPRGRERDDTPRDRERDDTPRDRERDDTPRDREQWVADLASDDTSTRRRAARVLTGMPDAVTMICAHLANEQSLSVRSIILTGLIVHKSPAVVRDLLPLLGSEDANLRNGAIEALQQMPDEVAPHVEAMLADPNSDVRIFAVDVLSALPHPMVPEWLRRVVTLDPHVNVCAGAKCWTCARRSGTARGDSRA